ncbi:uncharacterized protein PV07_05514 [Cladophialophora immunda]|uniref:Uncharacterized protein n=1 Tax=Cladophialophora immunda TaxID=569365 RepID=A0A0D2D1T8_9EURO|nr:uncharacterized protein PV07_05514 [Cladophialophora immunda]KIW29724.1 hypothetical protein PV07_05514 [Cladophialophora immunda]
MDPGELRARKDRFRIIVTIFVTELRALAASHLASPPESWDTDGALNKRFAWFLCGTLPEVLVDVICSTVTDATQFVIGKDRQGNPLRAAHFRFLPRVSRQDSQWGAYFDSLVNKITGEWMLYGGSAVGRRGLIGRELVYLLHSDTNGRHPKLLADPNWDPWICISADFSALAGLHAAYVRVVEDFLMTASPALSTEGPTFRWMTRQAKEFTNLVRQKMGLTLLPEEASDCAALATLTSGSMVLHQENLGIPSTIQADSPGSTRTLATSDGGNSSGLGSSSTNTSVTILTWPQPSSGSSSGKRKARSLTPGDDDPLEAEGLDQAASARRVSKRRTRSLLAPWTYFEQADDRVNNDSIDEDSDYVPEEDNIGDDRAEHNGVDEDEDDEDEDDEDEDDEDEDDEDEDDEDEGENEGDDDSDSDLNWSYVPRPTRSRRH